MKKGQLLSAALAGILAVNLAAGSAMADTKKVEKVVSGNPKATKDACKGKDHCKGKDKDKCKAGKDHCKGKDKCKGHDKDKCKGKDGCGGKDGCNGKEGK
jgi:hypothetical protein